jgi:hypothetical protein
MIRYAKLPDGSLQTTISGEGGARSRLRAEEAKLAAPLQLAYAGGHDEHAA